MLKLEKTDPRTRQLLLKKSLRRFTIQTDQVMYTSAIVNSDPVLKNC